MLPKCVEARDQRPPTGWAEEVCQLSTEIAAAKKKPDSAQPGTVRPRLSNIFHRSQRSSLCIPNGGGRASTVHLTNLKCKADIFWTTFHLILYIRSFGGKASRKRSWIIKRKQASALCDSVWPMPSPCTQRLCNVHTTSENSTDIDSHPETLADIQRHQLFLIDVPGIPYLRSAYQCLQVGNSQQTVQNSGYKCGPLGTFKGSPGA